MKLFTQLKSALTGFPAPAKADHRRQTVINGRSRYVTKTVHPDQLNGVTDFNKFSDRNRLLTDEFYGADAHAFYLHNQQLVEHQIKEALCR